MKTRSRDLVDIQMLSVDEQRGKKKIAHRVIFRLNCLGIDCFLSHVN